MSWLIRKPKFLYLSWSYLRSSPASGLPLPLTTMPTRPVPVLLDIVGHHHAAVVGQVGLRVADLRLVDVVVLVGQAQFAFHQRVRGLELADHDIEGAIRRGC